MPGEVAEGVGQAHGPLDTSYPIPEAVQRGDAITPLIEVVVARYKEDISWTKNLPARIKVTIYDKSGIPNDSFIQLPNVGHENHTYLYHIITRWESLSDVTIFSQGHPFDHCNDFLKQITGQIGNNFTGYGNILTCDNNGGPHHTGIPIILTCKQIGIKCPEIIHFYPGAQFSVSKNIIKKRTISFYQRVISLVDKENNPIYGYCLERLWPMIFR